jgi:hypothetical protein
MTLTRLEIGRGAAVESQRGNDPLRSHETPETLTGDGASRAVPPDTEGLPRSDEASRAKTSNAAMHHAGKGPASPPPGMRIWNGKAD